MKFEYNWTKDDLKKELLERRKITNIIFLIIGILLYIYVMYTGIVSNIFDNKIILLYGLIYTLILSIILFITTKLYVLYSIKKNDRNTNKAYGVYKVVLDENSITVSINNDKISYKYKDITKFKQSKHSFYIRTKEDKIGLRFNDKVLNKEDYDKLLEYMKQVVK